MEDRLYKFAKLVDAGSYTKAATQMHLSQPALTTAIQKLERELGTQLVVRGGRDIQLTAAGQYAYGAAQGLQAATRDIRLRVAEIAKQVMPLQLGMIDSVAELLFAGSQPALDTSHKQTLSLVIDNTDRLLRYTARGDLDVALTTRPAQTPGVLILEPQYQEPMLLLTAPARQAAVAAELQRRQLTHLLGYNQQSNTFRFIEQSLAATGIRTSYDFFSTSPHIMLEFLLKGRGAAILPYALARLHLQSGALTTLPVGRQQYLSRDIVLVRRRDRRVASGVQDITLRATRAAARLTDEAVSCLGRHA